MRLLVVGGYGHFYLTPAVKDGRLELMGAASDGVDGEAARAAAGRRFGDVPFFDDYRAALDELRPDVVNIGAVYAHNGAVVRAALERGAKVVSDKPIAATWAQLEGIEAFCRSHAETVLLTEFDLRARPAFRAAKRAVERGWIGEPVLATAQKSYRFGEARPWFYRQREHYGGTLLWIASHGLDLAWYVTGQPLTDAAGRQGNLSRPDYASMEDHVTVCCGLANGGTALVHADFLRPAKAASHGDDRIRVAGSAGLVEVRDGRCALTTHEAEATEITAEGEGPGVADELLRALDGEPATYSTAASLYMARVLLQAQDAVDAGEVRQLNGAAG